MGVASSESSPLIKLAMSGKKKHTIPEIEIPKGDSKEDIKVRKQIIGDFYAKWNAGS